MKTPAILKVNSHQFQAPALEELYLNFSMTKSGTTKDEYTEEYMTRNDISFMFSELMEVLPQLKVLWLTTVDPNIKLIVLENNSQLSKSA